MIHLVSTILGGICAVLATEIVFYSRRLLLKLRAVHELERALTRNRKAISEYSRGRCPSFADLQRAIEEAAENLPKQSRELALEALKQPSATGKARWIEKRFASAMAA